MRYELFGVRHKDRKLQHVQKRLLPVIGQVRFLPRERDLRRRQHVYLQRLLLQVGRFVSGDLFERDVQSRIDGGGRHRQLLLRDRTRLPGKLRNLFRQFDLHKMLQRIHAVRRVVRKNTDLLFRGILPFQRNVRGLFVRNVVKWRVGDVVFQLLLDQNQQRILHRLHDVGNLHLNVLFGRLLWQQHQLFCLFFRHVFLGRNGDVVFQLFRPVRRERVLHQLHDERNLYGIELQQRVHRQ